MLKITGSVIVIISSIILGNALCYDKNMKIKIFSEMCTSLSIISGEMKCGYKTLPEIFIEMSNQTQNKYMKNFFNNLYEDMESDNHFTLDYVWTMSVDGCLKQTFLTDRECEMIKEFSMLPIQQDVEMQSKFVESLVHRLNLYTEYQKKEVENKCKVYRCLSFSFGVMIVLLFL